MTTALPHEEKHRIRTRMRHHGMLVLLLVGLGVFWLKRDVCTLAIATAWTDYLGSWAPFMFSGLYGVAPTLHLRGAMPPTDGEALCGAILGMTLILMGMTIGTMVAYLITRSLTVIWRAGRLAGLPGTGSVHGARVSQVE